MFPHNFKECIQTLKSIYKSENKEDIECTRFLLNKYLWFAEITKKLGVSEAIELVESSNYDISSSKRKALKLFDSTQERKVKEMLKTYSNISTGVFISSSKSKELLQEVYQELGIKRVAKGTDIKKFITVEERNKRQKGELVKGFVILAT